VNKLPRYSLSIDSFQRGSFDPGYLRFLRAAQMLNSTSWFYWLSDSCAFTIIVSAFSFARFERILQMADHFLFSLAHGRSATLSGLLAAAEGYQLPSESTDAKPQRLANGMSLGERNAAQSASG
jgi:hypothetical protein